MNKFINPDTFFFVEFKINKDLYTYGPYVSLDNAIEILVDIAPPLAAIIADGKKYSYESRILEKAIDKLVDGNIEWKTINTPLKEEQSIFLRRK